jgi:hypothetical protein
VLGRLAAESRNPPLPLQAITWPPSAQGDFELQDHRIALQRACESSTGQAHAADQPLALRGLGDGDVGSHPAGHGVAAMGQPWRYPKLDLLVIKPAHGAPWPRRSVNAVAIDNNTGGAGAMCAVRTIWSSSLESLSNAAPILKTIDSSACSGRTMCQNRG